MKKVFIILIIVSGIPVMLWAQNLGTKVSAPFANINQLSVLSGDTIFVGTYSQGLYYSPDNGSTWVNITFPYQRVGTVYKSSKGDLYVDADYNGLYKMPNGTNEWDNLGLPYIQVGRMLEDSSGNLMLYATSYDPNYVSDFAACGIYLTKDDGVTWEQIEDPFYHHADNLVYPIYNLVKHPNGTIFAQANNGIFQSPTGEFWTYSGFSYGGAMTITSNGTIYQGGNNDYYVSTDTGKTWQDIPFTQTTLSIQYMFHDAHDAVYIEASDGSKSLLYKQTDASNQWTLLGEMNDENGSTFANEPQMNSEGDIFYLSNGYLYKINSSLTSIKKESVSNIPSDFSLSQNYPNPFNPTTTINYSIPSSSFVSLKVYDVLGNEVAILANEEKSPGKYSLAFNASMLSSGIYFYRIQAGDFMETKKLILLK